MIELGGVLGKADGTGPPQFLHLENRFAPSCPDWEGYHKFVIYAVSRPDTRLRVEKASLSASLGSGSFSRLL